MDTLNVNETSGVVNNNDTLGNNKIMCKNKFAQRVKVKRHTGVLVFPLPLLPMRVVYEPDSSLEIPVMLIMNEDMFSLYGTREELEIEAGVIDQIDRSRSSKMHATLKRHGAYVPNHPEFFSPNNIVPVVYTLKIDTRIREPINYKTIRFETTNTQPSIRFFVEVGGIYEKYEDYKRMLRSSFEKITQLNMQDCLLYFKQLHMITRRNENTMKKADDNEAFLRRSTTHNSTVTEFLQ